MIGFPINAGHHTGIRSSCCLGPFNALAFRFGYFHLVFSILYLDPADPRYLDEKEELWET